MKCDVLDGNPFAKICLDSIDAHIEEADNVRAEPVACRRVAEIDDSHAGLPKVRLPDGTIGAFDQIAMIRGFGKESRALRNVGIDPHADLQSAVVKAP